MSEKNANFAPMNDKNLIAVLHAKIAQLTVALDEAERNNNSAQQVARMEEFYRKQREEDKAYYEQRLESERQQHKQAVEALRQDIRELKQQHREEMRQLREDSKRQSAEQIEEYKRQMQMLNERLALLDNIAKDRELSAEEQKALARFRQKQKFKRSTEQRNLLNRREKEQSREEEKDNWDGTNSGAGNASGNTADIPAEAHTTPTGKKSVKLRKDCRKNVPYTDNPQYVSLEDYYTLPFGAKFVMRDGRIDTWQMRELVRIPEHYEERFYTVARVRQMDGELISTRTRHIPGCCFDTNLIAYTLGEHFVYNKPYRQICIQLKDLGLNMNDSTLGRQIHKVVKYFRNHMSDAWETILKTANYWMIDETPGLVGCETDGIRSYFKRYFWGIKAKALKLCWFLYENGSRGLKAIKPYLDQFIGFFTSDGYVVYKAYEGNDTPNQTRSACLTHIRRDFVNSLEENRELSYWFIDIFGKLFGLEYEYKKRNLTPEERLAERNSDNPGSTKRLMSLVRQRLKEFHESGYKGCGQLMTKALRYAYNEWKAMETVLKNGAVELSNNLAEQMMRHIKQNLKNSMNIGSEEAALDNAFMYSLIESCRMNNLSPVDYIRHLTAGLVSGHTNKRQLLPCFCKI